MILLFVIWLCGGLLFWCEWMVDSPPNRFTDFIADILIALPISLTLGSIPLLLRFM